MSSPPSTSPRPSTPPARAIPSTAPTSPPDSTVLVRSKPPRSPTASPRRSSRCAARWRRSRRCARRSAQLEPVLRRLPVDLARPQHGLREIRAIGRIGPHLRLEAEAGMRLVAAALQPLLLARHLVAGIELHAGLGGPHLHLDAGARALHPDGLRQCPAGGGQAKIMVVDDLIAALREADRARLEEIEGRALDRLYDAGRNELL